MAGVQPTARIRLFGGFDVALDGAGVPPLESARAESLLAYLVLHRDAPQSRQSMAFRLWPDSTEAQARTNLRHVLHNLRSRVPAVDRYIEITARTVRWRTEEPSWLDVAAFERLLATDDADGRTAALREAVGLYSGDLLEGHVDEWLLAERDRLRQRCLEALAELVARCEAQGELGEAISVAERLRRADPLREETYRQLMRLHAARGDRARAVAVYHDCSSTLERELGVAPAVETRAAYAELLSPEPAARGYVTPPVRGPALVGRTAERARLTAAWRSAEAGHAQFVLLTGEPGVGKTRLVDEFRAWCARRGAVVADARCYAAEGPLAYGPVAGWLRSPALRARLSRLDPQRLTELTRLLPELIGETPEPVRPEPLPEAELRHRLFDAIAGAVLAPGATVLLVVDDLHHGDAETCQVAHYLLRAQHGAGLLVVATARAEELDDGHPVRALLAALRATDRSVELELAPLDPAETATLAERLTGAPLTEPDLARLYAETEGNPLFVIEGMRAGWSGHHAVSPRVQAVIEARLAQLADPTRQLAETAALIGREFGVDVLAAAAGVDEDALVTGLDELWRRRIVRERGAQGYDFSHDKIREVAASGIGPARRRRLHLRIAGALEQGHDPDAAVIGGRVAAHYEQAGRPEQAATWYRRAAEALQQLHADTQAVALLERALEQLRTLPGSRDRDLAELEARIGLLAPLASVHGYASPSLSATQERAEGLARALGVEPAPTLLRSLAMSASTRADFPAAMRIGRRLQDAGERAHDDVLVVESAFVLGVAAFWQADFEVARGHLELAVQRYRPADRRAHLIHYGNDPKVSCLARLGNTLWFLGHPDEARQARAAAIAWADEIGHGYSRGIALWFGALLALDMGEEERVREYSAALSAGADSRQLQLSTAALRGYLTVLDGDPSAGTAAIRTAIERGRGNEAPGLQAMLHRILLAALLVAADADGAVAVADRMLEMGAGAQVWAAEARRVRAAFLERIG